MDKILEKILITGADGMVGSYIDFGIKTDRKDLDITNAKEVRDAVGEYQPMAILHLAAETNMEKCEKDPAHAYLVNSVGTYNLAMEARKIGAKMIYISTDDVFSSGDSVHSEKDTPYPSKVYGHSKYLGELAVQRVSDDSLVVRTSWIFGGGKDRDKKFVAKIIGQLGQDEIDVVEDQRGSTTFAKDLVSNLKKMILSGEKGLVHLTNNGICSRYEIAVEIANFYKARAKINPVSSDKFNLPYYMRASGGLISDRIKLRPWQEALGDYLSTEWGK
jgi:dTDP-4-dehydrorhamnose reductase